MKFKCLFLLLLMVLSVCFSQNKTKSGNAFLFARQVVNRGLLYVSLPNSVCQDSVKSVIIEITDYQHTHKYAYDVQDSLWRELTSFYPKH